MDKEFFGLVAYSIRAHTEHSKDPSNAVRRWDNKTPYVTHPIWCAMTILTENRIPENLRMVGAKALLLHDILEDTTLGLPEGLDPAIAELVHGMTFENSEAELKLIWTRSLDVQMLKLYDKYHNLLDGYWMTPERYVAYRTLLTDLSNNVEAHFGDLNIIRLARALPDHRS